MMNRFIRRTILLAWACSVFKLSPFLFFKCYFYHALHWKIQLVYRDQYLLSYLVFAQWTTMAVLLFCFWAYRMKDELKKCNGFVLSSLIVLPIIIALSLSIFEYRMFLRLISNYDRLPGASGKFLKSLDIPNGLKNETAP